MLRALTSQETIQVAMVMGSDTNKWKCNVKHEASRHYTQKMEYVEDKINDFAAHSKNKNFGDLHGVVIN
jgi:hypothetical protein